MDHDDDVCPGCEGEAITGLLISTVATVNRMHFYLHVLQGACDRHGIVVTGIVYDDY